MIFGKVRKKRLYDTIHIYLLVNRYRKNISFYIKVLILVVSG